MKIQDIKHSDSIIIELVSEKDIIVKDNTPIKIIQKNDEILLVPYNNEFQGFEVKGKDKKNQEIIDKIIKRNLPKLAYIISKGNNRNIILGIKGFADEKPMDLSLGVNEEFINKAKKIMKFDNIRNPEIGLNENFIIKLNGINYCVIGMNVNSDDEDYMNGFIISGKSGYIHIKQSIENEKKYFVANKISSKINFQKYKFYLVKGKIEFVNATEMEKARIETLACIKDIGSLSESYLNSWEKYGKIEQELILEKVKKAGVIKYINCEYSPNRNMYRLDIDEKCDLEKFSNEIDANSSITLFNNNPAELINSQLSIETYKSFAKEDKNRINCILGDKIRAKEYRIFIKPTDIDTKPPSSGYIIISLDGDMSRFERRKDARDKIMTAQSFMPHLAAILEGRSVPRAKRSRIEPLSPAVKEDIFPINDPTIKQREAIEIALNTPDIAIIQGPPGTGKTTVILGILKRLNEISDSSDGIFGKNLISAFQHDAVINAVERIEMLGLPAVKIGRKSGEGNDEPEVIEQVVENWISNKEKILCQKYKDIIKDGYLEKFDNIHNNYLYSANTLENTIKLLEEVKFLVSNRINEKLNDKLNNLLNDLRKSKKIENSSSVNEMIKIIQGIPYRKESINDNGKRKLRSIKSLLELDEEFEFDEEIEIIDNIIKNFTGDKEQLDTLRLVRKKILLELMPKENIFSTPKQHEEVLNIFSELSDELRKRHASTINGENQVLMEYISAFENNPLAIRNAVLEYVSVLGATNQQAKGKTIQNLKGESMYYDNVLVDEAARSNPLDLFIPMALAKDRIILVGDHRQLPHIVDEKILSDIEKNLNNDSDSSLVKKIQDNIKHSMFEHLFVTLKELEKKDGIKRTVTLDKQYRTHPVLGDFVSKNFYEKHGETHIESPLPAKYFDHKISGLESKACVWMDVPLSEGEEKRSLSGSKYRPIEAKRIVEHLKNIIDQDITKEMSFGIITFYSEQVNVIYEEMVKVGMATKNDNNMYEIFTKYSQGEKNGKKIEKLRIGTVDSFQGMEFDVVYLSTVRSNNLPSITEKQRRAKYGFLSYENRLCVSMSRQKKLLIVAGDSGMIHDINAEKAIQPLINYYNLCKNQEEYGAII